MVHTKETITELMKTGVVEVVFDTTKGVETTKYATLMETILPPRPVVESADENDAMQKKRKVNENQVSFWSVNDDGWRSFVIGNLKSVRSLSEGEITNLIVERVNNAQAV